MKPIGLYIKQTRENENDKRIIHLVNGMVFDVAPNPEPKKEKSPDFLILWQTLKVGALWKKSSKNGNDYLSGTLSMIERQEERTMINVLFSKNGNEVFIIDPAANHYQDETEF